MFTKNKNSFKNIFLNKAIILFIPLLFLFSSMTAILLNLNEDNNTSTTIEETTIVEDTKQTKAESEAKYVFSFHDTPDTSSIKIRYLSSDRFELKFSVEFNDYTNIDGDRIYYRVDDEIQANGNKWKPVKDGEQGDVPAINYPGQVEEFAITLDLSEYAESDHDDYDYTTSNRVQLCIATEGTTIDNDSKESIPEQPIISFNRWITTNSIEIEELENGNWIVEFNVNFSPVLEGKYFWWREDEITKGDLDISDTNYYTNDKLYNSSSKKVPANKIQAGDHQSLKREIHTSEVLEINKGIPLEFQIAIAPVGVEFSEFYKMDDNVVVSNIKYAPAPIGPPLFSKKVILFIGAIIFMLTLIFAIIITTKQLKMRKDTRTLIMAMEDNEFDMDNMDSDFDLSL